MIRTVVAGACIMLMVLAAVLTWIWAGIETATVDPTPAPVLTIVPASPTVYVFETMVPTPAPERLPMAPTPTTLPAVRILDTPVPTMTPVPPLTIFETPEPPRTPGTRVTQRG